MLCSLVTRATALTLAAGFSAEQAIASPEPVSPTVFGEVYRTNKGSLLIAKPAGPDGIATTGFLLGAEGEILIGADRPPLGEFGVVLDEELTFTAKLLRHDAELGLAVAKLVGVEARSLPRLPLRAAKKRGLGSQTWTVVITHGANGSSEPFAGIVEAPPAIRGRKAWKKKGALIANVAAPGRVGSPVLSARGELVGVVVGPGKRRVEVVSLKSLLPFLREAVLGQ
ncbi:MAG: trypsin-like peptidase domain-containing protein [Deltaproteobacteria bacterium]|nr:trypsin-like peptidase domain-containing protein [Deltaproteobacteria bacterium]